MTTPDPDPTSAPLPLPFDPGILFRPPVVVDARKVERTGIGRYVRELIAALAHTRGCPPFMAMTLPGIHSREFGIPGTALWPVDVRPFRPREGRLIRAELAHLKPAVFHAFHVNMPDLRDFGAKLVVTVHDLIPLLSPDYRGLKRLLFRRALERAIAQAQTIIVPSRATADALVKFSADVAAKIAIIREGVPRIFADSAPNIEPRPDGAVLAFASPRWHKNLDAVLRAHALSPEQVGEVHLVGAKSRGMTKMLKREGRCTVREIGVLPDAELRVAYESAFALVFPSRIEGFGLPIIEAMACGCPVIAAAVPALLETAGDAALVVDPENPGAIVAALNRLRNDPGLYAELQARGVARAAQFSWPSAATATAAIYRDFLA